MANAQIALGGFGSEGWGIAAWGEGSVSVFATGEVGVVTVQTTENIDVNATGVESTGAVGTIGVEGSANISVTGLEAIGFIGNVEVVQDADVNAVGVEGTGAVGSVAISTTVVVPVTGLQATASVGTVTVSAGCAVQITASLVATGEIGDLLIWSVVDDSQSVNWIEIVT